MAINTTSKYGPNVVRFDTAEYQFVTFHLKEYKGISRPRLLSEENMTTSFSTSAALNSRQLVSFHTTCH